MTTFVCFDFFFSRETNALVGMNLGSSIPVFLTEIAFSGPPMLYNLKIENRHYTDTLILNNDLLI